MTTDMAAIDRFHVGRIQYPLAGGLMGLPVGSSYVQFVPANVRVALAFPTPTQTGNTFSQALRTLCQHHGREEVMHEVQSEARRQEDPIAAVRASLEPAKGDRQVEPAVRITSLRGVYQDGQPWNGVAASLNPAGQWRFATLSSGGRTKPVTTFAREFQQANDSAPTVAWNGGYILNAELVGKLGLAESYIGSPLGLLISDGELLSPPLFNKPAFLVYPDGRLDIQRVNCSQGISISAGDSRFVLPASARNPLHPSVGQACFYDLLFGGDAIPGAGRVIVRLAGNAIVETLDTGSIGEVPILPVGLTLSFPADLLPTAWRRSGTRLRIEMLGWEPLEHAVEAGPMLVSRGQVSLDMETEGWETVNSIRAQAARLDFTDLRGPKIAIGLGKRNDLHLVAINGRIRESVGASHPELGQVLVGMGVQKAMGFDPGGSSTLVVHGRPINISPYNSDYQNNVVALPPQPRPVASAVIGYQI